jgi:hypothetical protein
MGQERGRRDGGAGSTRKQVPIIENRKKLEERYG